MVAKVHTLTLPASYLDDILDGDIGKSLRADLDDFFVEYLVRLWRHAAKGGEPITSANAATIAGYRGTRKAFWIALALAGVVHPKGGLAAGWGVQDAAQKRKDAQRARDAAKKKRRYLPHPRGISPGDTSPGDIPGGGSDYPRGISPGDNASDDADFKVVPQIILPSQHSTLTESETLKASRAPARKGKASMSKTETPPSESASHSPSEVARARRVPVDSKKVASRAAERKAAQKRRTQISRAEASAERGALGVSVDTVPAAAIDAGAKFTFVGREGELEGADLRAARGEARRAFVAYRGLLSRGGAPPVPDDRAEALAAACARSGLSCGQVIEALHRRARRITGYRVAPVDWLSPAALDGAVLEATATRRSDPGKRAAGGASGYVDRRGLDPRVIPMLRSRSLVKTSAICDEETWALSAQANGQAILQGHGLTPTLSREAKDAARACAELFRADGGAA